MAVVGNAYVIVQAVTTGFNRQVQQAINGINGKQAGQNVGKSFARGFTHSSGGMRKGLRGMRGDMEAARLALQNLIRKSYFLGPAIAVGVAAIGALVSGLVALGAQLGAAVPALVVFPSLMFAMAQAAVTAKLAFAGIGKAVSSMTKAKGGVDRMPAALERLTAAQERKSAADKRVTKTQEALTRAYADAANELEDLNFQAEDAVISEKKAALELEKARESLARVQDLPPNSRARKEAELAFAEAELGLRKAKDANKDLAAEQERVTKGGTLGLDETIKNMDSYKNAVEAADSALIDQAKAEREVDKAKQNVKDVKEGKGGGGGGEDPFKDLSPEAKKFAEFLATLRPKLLELRAAAGKQLFGALETSLKRLTSGKFFATLKKGIEDTGKALGLAALDFTAFITSANNTAKLEKVFETNNDTLSKSGKIFGALYDAFLSVLVAADPLIRRFTDWLVVLTGGWADKANANTESMTSTFNYAGDVMAQLGRIFGNLGGAIMNIGRAAAGPGSGGQMLFDMLEGVTAKFEAFTKTAEENGSLEQYFRDVAVNVGAIGTFFVEIVKQIGKLGAAPELKTFFDTLTKATPVAGEILRIFMGGAPFLGDFIKKFAELVLKFTETGGIQAFFTIINKAMDIMIAVFSNDMVMKIFATLAVIKGVLIAFSTLWAITKFYGLAVAGTVAKVGSLASAGFSVIKKSALAAKNMASNFSAARSMGMGFFQSLKMTLSYTKLGAAATKVWTGIQAAFNAVMAMNPIALIVLAIVALIAIFVVLYIKVEGFRDVVNAVFGFMLDIIKGVWNWIKDNWKLLLILLTLPIALAITVIQKAFGFILDVIKIPWNWIKTIWKGIKNLLSGPINLAKNLIKGYFNLVLGFLKIPYNWLVGNWAKIKGIMTGPINAIKSAFSGLKDSVIGIFKGMINFVIRGWNGIQFKIPGFKIGRFGYDGFTLRLPQIPYLAEGGIIQPSYGGTLARIGEAGQAERVEPLDPDGLSKRDKAMIKFMTGGVGSGIQITVNPSAGMDEVELADLIGRQLARQIRRGAA